MTTYDCEEFTVRLFRGYYYEGITRYSGSESGPYHPTHLRRIVIVVVETNLFVMRD